jgi:hypothetical protein
MERFMLPRLPLKILARDVGADWPRRWRQVCACAWRILSEIALLAISLLLFAWNILNVRFV